MKDKEYCERCGIRSILRFLYGLWVCDDCYTDLGNARDLS